MSDQDYLDLLDSAVGLINSEADEIDQLHAEIKDDIQKLDASKQIKAALEIKFNDLKTAIQSKQPSTTPSTTPSQTPDSAASPASSATSSTNTSTTP